MYAFPTVLADPMATQAFALSVVDVYDIAASIGREFESIIDHHGLEAVTELMPKVISVLEHLETLANRNQKENAEIAELKYTVEKLQSEKRAKAEERLRFEKELEQIEENWRKETSDLVETVAKLQEENRKLKSALSEQEGESSKLRVEAEEIAYLTTLKDTVDKQRDEMRALKKELGQKTLDVEAMQSQLERLAKMNSDYRRKSSVSQRQTKNLIGEKADLQAQLHDKEQQILKIKDMLREHDIQEHAPGSPLSDDDFLRLEDRLTLEGKMVIDLKDPNRPRFTLNELREVLQERNELKTKLIDVEEELQTYKPETAEDEVFEDDPPVQGPINKEPDEKLYPDRVKDSGIRKLFQRFLEKLNDTLTNPE